MKRCVMTHCNVVRLQTIFRFRATISKVLEHLKLLAVLHRPTVNTQIGQIKMNKCQKTAYVSNPLNEMVKK